MKRFAFKVDHDRIAAELPYGRLSLPGGRELLFNRRYEIIWERVDCGPAQRPAEQVNYRFYLSEFFYSDECDPTRQELTARRLRNVLWAWGVPEEWHAGVPGPKQREVANG